MRAFRSSIWLVCAVAICLSACGGCTRILFAVLHNDIQGQNLEVQTEGHSYWLEPGKRIEFRYNTTDKPFVIIRNGEVRAYDRPMPPSEGINSRAARPLRIYLSIGDDGLIYLLEPYAASDYIRPLVPQPRGFPLRGVN